MSPSLLQYGEMINDKVRINAYREALRRTVHSDSVVLDIGTGTGIFALLACQLGARRVYALDPNPWIELGRQVAAANGFGDRIEFIQEVSTTVTLPEIGRHSDQRVTGSPAVRADQRPDH